ncbi:MAG: hypothetical protein JRE24_05950 [Deltaproteobacteria bacterium]|jgi:hypothetical protein|nr:hypothetical protein [Deltaproteobacteria bacterium]
MDKEELEEYCNKPVVVDTGTPFIYIGTLSRIGNSFITLEDVDVRHDIHIPPGRYHRVLKG